MPPPHAAPPVAQFTIGVTYFPEIPAIEFALSEKFSEPICHPPAYASEQRLITRRRDASRAAAARARDDEADRRRVERARDEVGERGHVLGHADPDRQTEGLLRHV